MKTEGTVNEDRNEGAQQNEKKEVAGGPTDHLPTEPIHPSFLNLDSSQANHQAHHMPSHRVEPYPPVNLMHRRHYDPPRHKPSPPPITAITNSPSMSVSSLDRSSAPTPNPARRSPPHQQSQIPAHPHPSPPQYAGAPGYNSAYGPDPAAYQYRAQYPSQHHLGRPPPPHPHYGPGPNAGSPSGPPYPHDPYDGRYGAPPHPGYGPPPGTMHHQGPPPMPHGMPGPDMGQYQPGGYPIPGQMGVPIQFTDDAATKLSDRVRRRCFNCCTTDTSTWRRSNLNHGKVLCNKCGLFERTHSRPRPDQFPHKRGPLASSNLPSSRSPPSQHMPPNAQAPGLPPPQQHHQQPHHPHHPHPAGPGAPGGAYMHYPPSGPYHALPHGPPPPGMEGAHNGNGRPRGSSGTSSPAQQYINPPSLPGMQHPHPHAHWGQPEPPRPASPQRPEGAMMRRDTVSSAGGGSNGETAPGTPSSQMNGLPVPSGPGVPPAERQRRGDSPERTSANGHGSAEASRQGTPRMGVKAELPVEA